MSQYSITHKCGHVVTHNIVGTDVRGERGRKADWLAGTSCTECYRAKQRADAMAAVEGRELPPLTGSEKQIAWADGIRAKIVKDADDYLHKMMARNTAIVAEHPEQSPKLEAARVEADQAYANLCSQTAASWWIDHRYDSGQQALMACRQAVAA